MKTLKPQRLRSGDYIASLLKGYDNEVERGAWSSAGPEAEWPSHRGYL
jgi:hypothetical protein